ncbi:Secreted hypothetical protein [Micromonospora lupini str. Lupac 08]|uniref:Uncharacterized protein n=1 Tax=Micromonospora lupini str. Lupac 08 TaxID=1150864 RepID=I0KYE5_9ACTN|nr:Secreted hypothetical protein [Micromonospora lupini str. Lupac 08]
MARAFPTGGRGRFHASGGVPGAGGVTHWTSHDEPAVDPRPLGRPRRTPGLHAAAAPRRPGPGRPPGAGRRVG